MSTRNIGQMKHSSLSINIIYSSLGLHRTKAQTPLKGLPSTRQFLLLAKDLDKFCYALQQVQEDIRNHAPGISLWADGSSLTDRCRSFDGHLFPATKLKIVPMSSKHNLLDLKRQSELLSPFQTVRFVGLQVSFGGDNPDTWQTRSLKSSMCTTLVCNTTVPWNALKIMEAGKLDADNVAYAGDYGVAEARYKFLLEWVENLESNHRHASGGCYFSTANDEIYFRRTLRLFSLDLVMTRAYVKLKAGHTDGFAAIAADVLNKLAQYETEDETDRFSLPDETLSCLVHLVALARAFSADFDNSHKYWAQQRPHQLPKCNVRQANYRMANSNDPYQLHDAGLLRPRFDPALCSIRKLPLRCVDFRALDGRWRMPDHFVGWHDMDMLRATDKAKRRQIITMQMEGRAMLTNFRILLGET